MSEKWRGEDEDQWKNDGEGMRYVYKILNNAVADACGACMDAAHAMTHLINIGQHAWHICTTNKCMHHLGWLS